MAPYMRRGVAFISIVIVGFLGLAAISRHTGRSTARSPTDSAFPPAQRGTQAVASARDVYSLPYPQHLYAVEYTVNVLVATSPDKPDVSATMDSLLRQDYANLKVWVLHHDAAQADSTSMLLHARYTMEPHVAYLNTTLAGELEDPHMWALKRIRRSGTPNDIILVMDSEQNLISDTAVSQIVHKFVNHKPWVIHGSYLVPDGEGMTQVHTDDMDALLLAAGSGSVWAFRAFLVDYLNSKDFPEVEFASKAQAMARRMHYVLHILDLAGPERVLYMLTPLSAHMLGATKNGTLPGGAAAALSKEVVATHREVLANATRRDPLLEDIHIFLCIWGRKHLLRKTLQSLIHRQTAARRIRVHVWNNNPDIKAQVNKIAPLVSRRIDLVHSDVNLYSFARFLHIKRAMKWHFMDYAIIVDDDQLFASDYIEKLYGERLPKVFRSWWGRQFHGKSYFDGDPHGSVLIKGERPDLTEFDYAGPGGCIIDTGAFMMQATFMIPKPYISLDDLWLSYVMNMAGWKAVRTWVRPRFILDPKTTSVALWSSLKAEKDNFLDFLRAGGWQV